MKKMWNAMLAAFGFIKNVSDDSYLNDVGNDIDLVPDGEYDLEKLEEHIKHYNDFIRDFGEKMRISTNGGVKDGWVYFEVEKEQIFIDGEEEDVWVQGGYGNTRLFNGKRTPYTHVSARWCQAKMELEQFKSVYRRGDLIILNFKFNCLKRKWGKLSIEGKELIAATLAKYRVTIDAMDGFLDGLSDLDIRVDNDLFKDNYDNLYDLFDEVDEAFELIETLKTLEREKRLESLKEEMKRERNFVQNSIKSSFKTKVKSGS